MSGNSSSEPDPLSRLARGFSISYLYPIQRYTISNVLDGISQIVVMPTGGGKSLCYQLPASLLPGLTLVVVPLLSLLQDQLRRLSEIDIPGAALRGGQEAEERRRIMQEAESGALPLLFTTPEMLLSLRKDPRFAELPLHHLVIDEAHCVSEWGDSFRPSYLELKAYVLQRKPPVVTAFTATASPRVLDRIREILFPDRSASTLQESPDRPNISYRVSPCLSKTRFLHQYMSCADGVSSAAGPCVLFCLTREETEIYARVLRRRLPDRQVYFYHAGLTARERRRVESWFLSTETGLLTATSAYGMGVDKPNIRRAVHVGIPRSVEAYLQESGRIGRDGLPAEAVVLYSPQDLAAARHLDESVSSERRRQMRRYALSRTCRRQFLYRLMEQEVEVCSGCDVCDGTTVVSMEGEDAIIRFIRRNPRRYTPRKAVNLLCGDQMGHPAIARVFGGFRAREALHTWQRSDVEEALESLLAAGSLRLARWGFWKGKISASQTAEG